MSARGQTYAAFTAVYLIWGSTYLAIGEVVVSVPPVFMVAVRGMLAGGVLYWWARRRGARPFEGRELLAMVPTATLLFGGGYVLVGWAEQEVPSGAAALLNATTPAWVVLFEWLTRRRARPRLSFILALVLGVSGVGLLVGAGANRAGVPIWSGLALVLASVAWAGGTLRAHAHAQGDPLRDAALQMVTGGLLLLPVSLLLGEGTQVLAGMDTRSLLALAYLVVFGSLVAYTAYVWLLHHVAAAKVASHAYVNPLIAVLVGAGLAGERIYGSTLVAAGLIIASVYFIIRERTAAVSAPEIAQPSPRPRIAA